MKDAIYSIASGLHHEMTAEAFERSPTLWHYTDAAGLLGIIREGRIRLTNARYLNDEAELRRGVLALKDAC